MKNDKKNDKEVPKDPQKWELRDVKRSYVKELPKWEL